MVRDYGYAGLFLGQDGGEYIPHEFVPRQCVFCLHNEALNAEERLSL
jgi:hypothetical protein